MRILDANGDPIDTGALREPQSSRVVALQHQMIESQLDGLTPAKAARVLKDADRGDLTAQAQLFDDMLDRDPHLRCEFDKRQGAPVGMDWSIEPPSNASAAEKAAAAFAEEMLRDTVDDLEDVVLAMMEAPGFGYAAIELEWARFGQDWIPSFHPRPQTWLTTDLDRRELRLADGSAGGTALQPMGWIVHQHKKVKTGYLGRAGLFRACLWPFLYKAYAVGDFAEFLETYGLPIIVGKYMSGATGEEKASLMRAVTALGHDARAIMPEGMALEIKEVVGGAGGSHHLNMVDWADRAQSKAVLGQTTSSEAKATGLGSGVADLHGQVRRDILKSDARQLAGTLTRDLVYPLIALNRPGVDSYRRCPRFVFDHGDAEDLKAYADALPKLVGVGFKIPRAWGHEKLRIPEPDGKEDVLAVAATPRSPSEPPELAGLAMGAYHRWRLAAAAQPAANPPRDAIDALVDTVADDWAPMIDPLINPLQAAIDEASAQGETAEQFLARLPGLLEQMDVSALTEQLARAAFTARLAAQAGIEADDGA